MSAFRDGGAYTYSEVPVEEWLALWDAATSTGCTFVSQVIKPRYDTRGRADLRRDQVEVRLRG